jgi:hypothetical protein
MKQKLILCILSVVGLTTAFASAQNYIEGEVIVKYKDTIVLSNSNGNLTTLSMLLPCEFSTEEPLPEDEGQPTCLTFSSESFTLIETFSVADEILTLLEGKQGETTAELLAKLSQDPRVEYVEPNYLYTTFATFTPNDPDYAKLRGLDNIHRPETMQVFSGKTATTGSIVAVIDL